LRFESILDATRVYHVWHPREATFPTRWREGFNVAYLLRPGRLTRCRNGSVSVFVLVAQFGEAKICRARQARAQYLPLRSEVRLHMKAFER
jgi:hypothetical protein